MKVVDIEGDRATAQIGDVTRQIGLALVPDVQVGDYVVVHAGFAIHRLDEQEALETLELFAQMAHFDEQAEQGKTS